MCDGDQRAEEQVKIARFQELPTRRAPPDQQAGPRCQHGPAGPEPHSARRHGKQQRHQQAANRQAGLISGRSKRFASQCQEQLRRPAAAVKQRRLRIARLERRIEAAQRAALAKRTGAETAVVQVQGVLSRDDRLVVEEPSPGLLGPEKRQRHPCLPGEQPKQDQRSRPLGADASISRSFGGTGDLPIHSRANRTGPKKPSQAGFVGQFITPSQGRN